MIMNQIIIPISRFGHTRSSSCNSLSFMKETARKTQDPKNQNDATET